MKQFNLREYLENPSREVVTRDGKPARIICTNANSPYPIVALYCDEAGIEYVCSYKKDGSFSKNWKSDKDLFFALKKKEGYINLFRQITGINTSFIFNTKEEAEKSAKSLPNYITTIKIEWEE